MANWDMAQDFIKAQRASLASKSYAELTGLDEFETIPTPEALRPFQFTVYRKALPDGSLKVIVEAWKTYFFGVCARNVAEGFVVSPSGAQRELAPDEL